MNGVYGVTTGATSMTKNEKEIIRRCVCYSQNSFHSSSHSNQIQSTPDPDPGPVFKFLWIRIRSISDRIGNPGCSSSAQDFSLAPRRVKWKISYYYSEILRRIMVNGELGNKSEELLDQFRNEGINLLLLTPAFSNRCAERHRHRLNKDKRLIAADAVTCCRCRLTK